MKVFIEVLEFFHAAQKDLLTNSHFNTNDFDI
jgi:hypothetical protein